MLEPNWLYTLLLCIKMLKLKEVCESMQTYHEPGIKHLHTKSAGLNELDKYKWAHSFLGHALQHSRWPWHSQIRGLRVHFQRPDVSLVLDTDFPDLRFDRILLDAMSLQIQV